MTDISFSLAMPPTDMNLNYLDFEQPIAELEGKIEALESIKNKVDISQEESHTNSKLSIN
jgi:acetyl-CoA carboxylase alpha subunit